MLSAAPTTTDRALRLLLEAPTTGKIDCSAHVAGVGRIRDPRIPGAWQLRLKAQRKLHAPRAVLLIELDKLIDGEGAAEPTPQFSDECLLYAQQRRLFLLRRSGQNPLAFAPLLDRGFKRHAAQRSAAALRTVRQTLDYVSLLAGLDHPEASCFALERSRIL